VVAELEGKVAVITGAGSGMGRTAAEVFLRYGAKVARADISGREREAAESLGKAALAVRCDVTREPDVEAMMAVALKASGRIDAVLEGTRVTPGMPGPKLSNPLASDIGISCASCRLQ
jgi:NAD(P)-dependent dehydrogenase (short-subunit alcohol dehydrogenase family)